MKKIILPILALILILSFVKADEVFEDLWQCDIIELNESLTLNQDQQGGCYWIAGKDITLDCNGHTLTGNGKGAGIKVDYVGFEYERCDEDPSGWCGGWKPSENITIKNCVIENYWWGVLTLDTHGEVKDNIFKNNDEGARISTQENFQAQSLNFYNNHLINNKEYGLRIGCQEIGQNEINNNRVGVYISCTGGGSFSNQILRENEIGLLLSVENYEVSSNQIIGKENLQNVGIAYYKIIDSKINDTLIKNYAKGINKKADYYGVTCSNTEITNNEIKSNQGISVYGDNNKIKNNILIRNYVYNTAIELIGNSNEINSNQILNRFGRGIRLSGDSNIITDNSIVETVWGNLLIGGNNNVVENNEILEYIPEITSQSYIKNNGDETVTIAVGGFKVQKKVGGIWRDDKHMYGAPPLPFDLQPGETHDFIDRFNQYPNQNFVNEPGEYRLRLYISDHNRGELLRNADGTPLEKFYYFNVVDEFGLTNRTWTQRIWEALRRIFN